MKVIQTDPTRSVVIFRDGKAPILLAVRSEWSDEAYKASLKHFRGYLFDFIPDVVLEDEE